MNLKVLIYSLGALLLFQPAWAVDNCYTLKLKNQNAENQEPFTISLAGTTKINLFEGPFSVMDADGTDGSASLSLPNPDPFNSGTTKYSVLMRLLGKPGTGVEIQSCYFFAHSGFHCSQQTLQMQREAGKPELRNVSKDLLYVFPGQFRVPLFENQGMHDYFWTVHSTEKLKAELQFCLSSTQVDH